MSQKDKPSLLKWSSRVDSALAHFLSGSYHSPIVQFEARNFSLNELFPTRPPSAASEGLLPAIICVDVGKNRRFEPGNVAFSGWMFYLWDYLLSGDVTFSDDVAFSEDVVFSGDVVFNGDILFSGDVAGNDIL